MNQYTALLIVCCMKDLATAFHCFIFFSCQSNADLTFGGITIVCGIFGTLGGGYVLDRMNSTISNAFKVVILIQGINLAVFRSYLACTGIQSCIIHVSSAYLNIRKLDMSTLINYLSYI